MYRPVPLSMICFWTLSVALCANPATVNVMFGHGTKYPGVGVLTNSCGFVRGTYKPDDLYPQVLAELRADREVWKWRPIQDVGLYEVNFEDLQHQCLAAYQLARMYALLEPDKHFRFFTLGWSGELSDRARRQAGDDLRNALLELPRNPGDSIRAIFHSHGGNVLAHAIDGLGDDVLSIDHVTLLGMPAQDETAHMFTDPRLKQVLAVWSGSDGIADKDRISTRGRSTRQLLPKIKSGTQHNISDVEICIEDRPCVDHRGFYYFGVQGRPFFNRTQRATLDLIHPLPVAALSFLLKQLVDQAQLPPGRSLRVNITQRDGDLLLQLSDRSRPKEIVASLCKPEFAGIRRQVLESWYGAGGSSHELVANITAGFFALGHRLGCVRKKYRRGMPKKEQLAERQTEEV